MITSTDAVSAVGLAVRAIEHALRTGRRWRPDALELTGRLAEPGACFVTLRRDRVLLGCIGSLQPRRPLGLDVAENAAAAAFDDPRLPAVTWDDLPQLSVHVSVLGPLVPLDVASRDQLVALVRPHVDGLLIEDGWHRATFLPSVWSQLDAVDTFLDGLWAKAGLTPGVWPSDLRVACYEVDEFAGTAADHLVV